jgi:superfamily II DNA or RNA helicase
MADNGILETQLNGENSPTVLADIIIKPHNEVFIRVDCERSIAQELYDHFSFYVPGYKFMPTYKSRVWDGKIRLFNINTQRIYKGLIKEVKKFAELAKDFEDYNNGPIDILKITGDTDKQWKNKIDSNIVISTWQSMYKQPRAFYGQFGVIIGDEAHLFKAKSLTSILEKMTDIKYRFGFTGTLDGSQTHQLVLEGLFGPIKSLVKTKELMDSNQLANLDIKILVLKYSEQTCKNNKNMKYQQEMDFIVSSNRRNRFIQNLSLSLKGNTLILFQYVEKHGKILYDLINNKITKDRKLFFVFGGTDGETRESIREITEKETNAIIIASYGTFSTGINIRALHNIIFASPSKSKIRNLQSIGRGLRTNVDKEQCTLFDISDDMQYKKHINYTLRHLYERVKIYNQEKFNYKLYKIDLES